MQAEAKLRLRRRRAAREVAEVEGAVVLMPALDPVPVPPEYLQEEAGARAVKVARDNQLAALMAAWRRNQR
jgi:hypothetical protein